MERANPIVAGVSREVAQADTVTNPFDGTPVGEVGLAGAELMDEAIAAAEEAFGVTRRLATHERVRVLEGVAASLAREREALAALMTSESGKPIRFSRGEVDRAVVTFELAAAEARSVGGEVWPIDLEARSEGRLCLTTRVPRGPVAAIAPFNFPLNLIAHKLAPAIAVGAPVVLKLPPQCPLTGLRLAQLVLEAGWPAQALSALHCAPEVAQRMVEDERMAVVSFTGSDAVGWRLKALAGRKPVLLELGGNAPCVVDAGADLEAALPAILGGAWAHAGQVCIKVQRLFVHASLFDDFLERFVQATKELPCGDPTDPATVVGPMIEPGQVERVLAWVREAVEGGARLHCGGTSDGQVVAPTILTGVEPHMRVCKDEVFGPVTVLEPFDDFDAVLERCNATRFGLQAGVFTPDVGRALRAYRELDYGGVVINDVPTFRVDSFPYGGTKASGLGREGVRAAMEELSEPKVLVLR